MITTNNIQMLLDEIELLPHKPTENSYKWLKDLLNEVNNQPMTSIQIAVCKSINISDMLREETL